MPLRTFTGPDVPRLLAQAQQEMGPDAVVLATRRIVEPGGVRFEVTAGDPASAAAHAATRAPRPLAPARALPAPPEADATPAALRTPRRWPRLAQREPAEGPRVVALVGPTGAGKTTTLAKLANHPDAFAGRRVGLVCLDTYRVGAVEQARIYAELSRMPFEVAHDRAEAARALRRLRGCEIVLVDTAGRGPAARAELDETRETLAPLAPHEVHLVLPAGLRPELAERVVREWVARGVTHLLPSKLDECPGDTTPFDLAVRYRLRVRWSADGQEVPDDLRAAAGDVLAASRRVREPEPAGVA